LDEFDCRSILFGSLASGVATKHSDVDLAVLPKSKSVDDIKSNTLFLAISRKLKIWSKATKTIFRASAKVPVICFKFNDADNGDTIEALEVDISLHDAAEVIYSEAFLHAIARSRKEIIAVKSVFKFYGIIDSFRKRFSSFVVMVLVLHFQEQKQFKEEGYSIIQASTFKNHR